MCDYLFFIANVLANVFANVCCGKNTYISVSRYLLMKQPVTLKQLSKMLNLSIATISRALKNHPDISEETRRKVRELADMLDYEPNAYAIGLKTNHSKEFGIIVPEISGYFYTYFIAAIEEEARRYGYSVIILQSGNDPLQEQESIRRCRKNRVAGLFVSTIAGTEEAGEYRKLEDSGMPVIFFDKVPVPASCNKVCVADEDAARLAAGALLAKSKKNILAFFGNMEMSISQVRKKAFCDELAQKGPEAALVTATALTSEEAYRKALKALGTRKKPDAVFCMSDEILSGVMKAVQQLKIAVPQDLGIIAISNGFIPLLYYPEVTYVETSGFKLGKLAFARMMSCMAGSTFMQTIVADAVLVTGGSL